MAKFKLGQIVRVTASKDELVKQGCNPRINTGSVYKITKRGTTSDQMYELDNIYCGWVLEYMIEPYDDGDIYDKKQQSSPVKEKPYTAPCNEFVPSRQRLKSYFEGKKRLGG